MTIIVFDGDSIAADRTLTSTRGFSGTAKKIKQVDIFTSYVTEGLDKVTPLMGTYACSGEIASHELLASRFVYILSKSIGLDTIKQKVDDVGNKMSPSVMAEENIAQFKHGVQVQMCNYLSNLLLDDTSEDLANMRFSFLRACQELPLPDQDAHMLFVLHNDFKFSNSVYCVFKVYADGSLEVYSKYNTQFAGAQDACIYAAGAVDAGASATEAVEYATTNFYSMAVDFIDGELSDTVQFVPDNDIGY